MSTYYQCTNCGISHPDPLPLATQSHIFKKDGVATLVPPATYSCWNCGSGQNALVLRGS